MSKRTPNVFNDLDSLLNSLGVRYTYLTHDTMFQEQIARHYDLPHLAYFCELSWGSGDDDSPVEFAVNCNGNTPGEAIQNCIDSFFAMVKENYPAAVEVAKIYHLEAKDQEACTICGGPKHEGDRVLVGGIICTTIGRTRLMARPTHKD